MPAFSLYRSLYGALVFVLEERLVRANHFGVLLQTLADSGAKADEPFHALGGEERIAEDFVGFLADAIYPPGALDEADDGPGQVVVHDDGAVLQILAFAEHVRGDQDANLLGILGSDLVRLGRCCAG